MPEKPKCERCGDTWFMNGNALCRDCAKWFASLGHDARLHDHANWGATASERKKPKPAKEPKSALEQFGFTPLSEMKLP